MTLYIPVNSVSHTYHKQERDKITKAHFHKIQAQSIVHPVQPPLADPAWYWLFTLLPRSSKDDSPSPHHGTFRRIGCAGSSRGTAGAPVPWPSRPEVNPSGSSKPLKVIAYNERMESIARHILPDN
ncbi:hypothetical protein [Paenibacillus rigui]|uniref:Uncharacterized protein n=1 Tax=Paenibacillus rigui TaxID=554312 RepID=A0A229UHH3_9BACL|nr:hypothetical protein [Paenibacillus rigui]OXM82810.1 hypothetical protein CF651_29555 [Paenibacillus rigui]